MICETIPQIRLTFISLSSGQGLFLVVSTHLDCLRLRALGPVEANSSDIDYWYQHITSTRIACLIFSEFLDLAIKQ